MTARTHDYLWLLVDASAWALFSALVTDMCVKFKQGGAGVVLGSMLHWLCAGRRVLLGGGAVKSGMTLQRLVLDFRTGELVVRCLYRSQSWSQWGTA